MVKIQQSRETINDLVSFGKIPQNKVNYQIEKHTMLVKPDSQAYL